MTYVSEITEYNRKKKVVNVAQFAADLAAALGGRVEAKRDRDDKNRDGIAYYNDVIDVSANSYPDYGRVNLYIAPKEVKPGEWSFYDEKQKTKSISVDPDRPMAILVKDIRKRLIEANAPALAARREYAKQRGDARVILKAHVDALVNSTGGAISACIADDGLSASIGGCGNLYLDATMSSDGSVWINRIGSIGLTKFAAIVALLSDK